MASTESDDAKVLIISVAARMAGMHPQTLRQYDRLGLVQPGRTPGGGRRYSVRDVAMLREIQRLSQDEGINLAGVNGSSSWSSSRSSCSSASPSWRRSWPSAYQRMAEFEALSPSPAATSSPPRAPRPRWWSGARGPPTPEPTGRWPAHQRGAQSAVSRRGLRTRPPSHQSW